MDKDDYRKMAKDLGETSIKLIGQILEKHNAAIIEEMHDTFKQLQARIAELESRSADSLPYITDDLLEAYGESKFIEWNDEIKRPSWTQDAVDFACLLSEPPEDKT